MTHEQTGLNEAVVGGDWARPRGWARPRELDLPLDALPGVGAPLARKLRALGLQTVSDLLLRRPRRYETAVEQVAIAELWGEDEVVVNGVVRTVRLRRLRGRRTLVTARIEDASGSISATWFNQPWVAERLQPGTAVRLRGRLGRHGFDVRSYDVGEARATADFAPVYRASEQVPSTRLRELVRVALTEHARDVLDPLPAELELPLRRDALWALHFPDDSGQGEHARRRLALDELLALQLAVLRSRDESAVAPELGEPGELVARYREALPFVLTDDQELAIRELDRDLARAVPMHRLLQGDVGSGKTVVALYALLRAVEAGRQGALMVPTETLAEQHFMTIESICTGLGVRAVLVTSAAGSKRTRAELADGTAQIAVGTHALIQREVEFADLAVAVVDEQHRFGVEQRSALMETSRSRGGANGAAPEGTVLGTAPESDEPLAPPGGDGAGVRPAGVGADRGREAPHVLHMTATPIPRTLALTVYGDLAVTEIAKPPASRKPVVTAWVGAERSRVAYERLRAHLDAGRQAYVVCPLIEASETRLARAAEAEAERLRRAELAGYRVGLMHGRLKAAERREVMRAFKERELDVLVATTVIEVGVDVPNATIMIVQEADRFGLAQLHQLRGRVGRGAEQSYCLLISRPVDELTDAAQARLQALVDTTDGFELAERDLELRGEGALLGTRQSGLSDLRFTRLRADHALLQRARELARELVERDGPWQDEADRLLDATDPGRLA
jgi:ATP-dependent DNA helicase RecG